ncbi:hypothetical protein EJ110_NYTH18567 [Nymphaea thermarum]|nr:hypothetical protein EJ110_NYTH18567 [Nymphaea thermarum]
MIQKLEVSRSFAKRKKLDENELNTNKREIPASQDCDDHINIGEQSTRDLDGLDLWFWLRCFRHSYSKYPVLHGRLHLIEHHVLRQPESAEELAAASLHSVPLFILLLALSAPLPAYFEHVSFFELHLHLFLLQSREVGLEDVGFGRLLPVDLGVGDCGGVTRESLQRRGGNRVAEETIKGIPDLHGEGIVSSKEDG